MKIITKLPLDELSFPQMQDGSERKRYLTAEQIRELLQVFRGVHFIMADIGHPLTEIPLEKCFEFWKNDVAGHVCDAENINIDAFPGSFCFVASDWGLTAELLPIVLLEKFH